MAIANYKMNFFGESRLLPVSLVLITSMTFMMALYFTNQRVAENRWLHVLHCCSAFRVWKLVAQVEGGFPPIEEKKDFSNMPRPSLLMRVRNHLWRRRAK